jgi:hypothetical protein
VLRMLRNELRISLTIRHLPPGRIWASFLNQKGPPLKKWRA